MSRSTVKLTDTYNVSLHKKRTFYLDGQRINLVEIPAIGDGNCAFNSFSLWFINYVLTTKNSRLPSETIDNLISAISNNLDKLEERQKLYAGIRSTLSGNQYSDLAKPLQKFITFMKSNPDQAAFLKYIREHATSRQNIAALHVGLAPGFRVIGVGKYSEQMRDLNIRDVQDFKNLLHDGQLAGHESLTALGKVFGVNVILFDRDTGNPILPDDEINEDVPNVYILHVPGHFNYLIDENLAQQIEALKIFNNSNLSQNNAGNNSLAKNSQQDITELLLWHIETSNRLTSGQYKPNSYELEEITKVNQAIYQLKTDLKITKDNIHTVGIPLPPEFAWKLLSEPLIVDNGTNDDAEKIAKTLQNTEILLFFQEQNAKSNPSIHPSPKNKK